MAKDVWLHHMTRKKLGDVAPHATLIFPTAAIEQHGPHLPLVTDHSIAEAVAERVAAIASEQVPVCIAPVLSFGNSHHHLPYAALSLRSETYLAVLTDLIDCAVESGFRRIFILNAHGGNHDSVRLAAKDLVLRSEVAISACSYWDVAKRSVSTAGIESLGYFPGHAGGFETAVMMTLAPELVDQDALPNHADHPTMINYRGLAEGLAVFRSGEWRRVDGYSDVPLNATAEMGARLLGVIAEDVAKALVSFHQATEEGHQRQRVDTP